MRTKTVDTSSTSLSTLTMKFGIDIGHNCPPDTGASGIPGTNKSEDVLAMAVGKLVIQKLYKVGHTVVECKPSEPCVTVRESLQQRVNKANTENVDIFISIHFNDSKENTAYGAEVFAISQIGKQYARSVCLEICNLGFFNRGVKDGSHLFVVRETKASAILIECCFCDNKQDMAIFNAELMAEAIAEGLLSSIPT